ncbi:MAG: ATP-binding protein [Bdellovibrio sp.]|nr:ATP-binding protein [Bdellovibrio sp.]
MTTSLADQLQVWGFEGDTIIFQDGSQGMGLQATPIDVSCWDNERVNQLSEKICQFLNGLPIKIDLQFIQEITSGNEEVISKHEKLAHTSNQKVVTELTRVRAEKLRHLDAQGFLPKHGLKIFLRRPMAKPLLNKPSLFSKPKAFPEIAEKELERELTMLERLRIDLTQSLTSLGLVVKPLNSDEIMDILYSQWNPTRKISRGSYDPEEIRSSLLFTDILIDEKGFSLSDMHYRVVSLKILPEQTFSAMAGDLRDLPFDSKLFLTLHVPDQQEELSKLQTQRRLAYSMARGKHVGVSDIESETKFQDLETLLEQMIAQGEKIFHSSLNVLLRAKSQEELENQVSQTLSKVRSLSGAEGMEESLAAFDIFSEFSIPNARAKERMKRIKTSNLADFLPLYGPWSGHAVPSILLRSRHGSLVSFDPFSPDLTNYNHIVSGGSGSGKSFFTNILLLQLLKENPKVFIVDIGGSYKKLCDHLAGQYIPLGITSDISINPFDLPTGEVGPSNEKIKFLVSLVEIMTKEEGESRLPRLERAEMEDAISQVYEKNNSPRLSHLREILLNHPDTIMKRFGRILTPWCGDSPFGRFVDRPTNLSLSKSLVSFDLKGLESVSDLQSVCLFIITDYVWREVQKDRSVKKVLVFDECWKLLENDAGATFIAEVFRTFRKYYASVIAISQNMDDFAKSKVSGAILSNSSIKWILMQRGADQARLKEVLQLNDNEMGLISSLHQERGLYSEAFLMAEANKCVVAVESTALEYWIATTDPRDLTVIENYLKENPEKTNLEALNALSELYPRGVTASQSFQTREGDTI